MLQLIYDDPAPHIHLAATEVDGFAWAGLPEEELPIIGEVFNHFFTNALTNSSADQNSDGEISVEEAFAFASPLSRSYISTVVFPAFPYFEEMCNLTAPLPVIDDAYPGNFSLQIETGEPPVFPPIGIPLEVIFSFISVLFAFVIIASGVFVLKKR